MKAIKTQTGFTIVETLIVLAIMGFLFVSTTLLVQGQINKYQQRDAVLQLQAAVSSTLNDVANGYYPDIGTDVTCPFGGSSGAIGTSTACVYAGKKVTFGADDITIETLATTIGRTTAPNPTLASDALPVTGLTETKEYKWGIKPTATSAGKVIYIINATYGKTLDADNKFLSGSQNVIIVDSTNTVIKNTDTPICFENGDQNSSLTINGSGSLQVEATPKSSCT